MAVISSPSPLPPPPPPAPPEPPPPPPEPGPLPGQNLPLSGPISFPLLIQIENTWESRPQAGIGAASVIFEYLTEGGVTRFSALFHRVPGVVGPVRSARFVSVYIYRRFGALLMASGGSNWTYQKIFAEPGLQALINDFNHDFFFRWGGRAAPHNLYTSQAQMLRAAGTGARSAQPGDFARAAIWAGSEGAPTVSIPALRTVLNYDGGAYSVITDGAVQNDVVFGPVKAQSVAVLHVNQWITNLTEDVTGGTARDFDVSSGGVAELYAKGTVIHGRWQSPSGNTAVVLTDAAGQPVGMPPGLLWVALAP